MDAQSPDTVADAPRPAGQGVAQYIRQGCSLLGAGRIDGALACFRRAIEIDDAAADAHFWLGATLEHSGRAVGAEPYLRRAIELNASHADAHARLGLLLARRGEHREAVDHYLCAVSIAPRHADAWCNAGISLFALKRHHDAEQAYRAALALQVNARTLSNLGNLLVELGRHDEAERCYEDAMALDPAYAPVHDNIGVMRAEQGRRRESEAAFRQALALDPENAQAALNLSHLLLAEGRLEEGWKYYEARYSLRLPGPSVFVPSLPFPQWCGEPVAGKSLLVWLEQGLGDELQFCRYLPLLKAMGVTRLSFVCRPELFPLMQSLHGVDTLVPLGDDAADLSGHDFWSFTMSLALCCGTTLHTIPADVPYLSAPPSHMAPWSVRLPRHGFRVGVVWRGNPLHHNDGDRSLVSLEVLAPLWTVPGVTFISLQKGVAEEEAKHPPSGQSLTALGQAFVDFGDTAAVVAQLDLVICVDTSVAHLAGAMGKPCWLMLPARHPDWRWMLGRHDTPWYPTMRLWRQTVRGDWAPVVEDMRLALVELVRSAADP